MWQWYIKASICTVPVIYLWTRAHAQCGLLSVVLCLGQSILHALKLVSSFYLFLASIVCPLTACWLPLYTSKTPTPAMYLFSPTIPSVFNIYQSETTIYTHAHNAYKREARVRVILLLSFECLALGDVINIIWAPWPEIIQLGFLAKGLRMGFCYTYIHSQQVQMYIFKCVAWIACRIKNEIRERWTIDFVSSANFFFFFLNLIYMFSFESNEVHRRKKESFFRILYRK